MNSDNTSDKQQEKVIDKNLKNVDEEGIRHLTSDIHIRYRGHKSELDPHHGELTSTMKTLDIHDEPKPINYHLTSDLHIRNRGHKSELEPHHGQLESTYEGDIHDIKKTN